MIDPANSFNDVCKPFTEIPAWWSGFLFHVLNTRQLSVYLYLSMLADGDGTCHPTTNQIRQDLGLSSLTIIFDAMSVLEAYGFVLRRRQTVPGSTSRRNVYQRPSCEFTVLRLLQ
ncbi:MAG: Helix-turn-helix domain, partial [Candidatus Eremiobacteraeota bacterium]|nr:Helix-turn-helix domain [Candidatus Eremiobacteraeota bacterium]